MVNSERQEISFEEIKRVSWKVVQIGAKLDFNKEWKKKYIENKFEFNSLLQEAYMGCVQIYIDYIKQIKNKEDCIKELQLIENEYTKKMEILKRAFLTKLEVNNAFKKARLVFGEVTFTCPICGGTAHASRIATPDNLAHSVSERGYCEKCGQRWMN